jgi:hypothetical protein
VRTEIYREKSNFYSKSHGLPSAKSSDDQRTQQLVRGVRRAFLLTITVTDSESLLPEIPELPNLEGLSAE